MSAFPSYQPPPLGFTAALGSLLNGSLDFEIHYQPIVDLSLGVVAGFEALARLPKSMSVAPDRCLSYADLLGHRLELEELFARRAIEQRGELMPNSFLSINVSPMLLLSDSWRNIVKDAGAMGGLVIEITEGDAVRDYDAVRRELDTIRHAGGLLAVDDTGSGYASLKHVMELRPDFIKLDRLFIQNCAQDPIKRAMIELLGETADKLDAWIVAEGIETEGELDEILRLEVPLAQGHLLGYPERDMKPLAEASRAHVQGRRATLQNPEGILRQTDLCPTANNVERAVITLSAHPEVQTVVVTDSWNRPMEVLDRHPLVGVRKLPSVMRAHADSDPHELLTRALTRSAAECYDPIAVIDEQGLFVGVVRVDRLMRAVLGKAESRARSFGAAN